MGIFDSTITILMFVPFSVLALYYFAVVMDRTLQDWKGSVGWEERLQLVGMVLVQFIAAVLFVLWIYVIIWTKFWK